MRGGREEEGKGGEEGGREGGEGRRERGGREEGKRREKGGGGEEVKGDGGSKNTSLLHQIMQNGW